MVLTKFVKVEAPVSTPSPIMANFGVRENTGGVLFLVKFCFDGYLLSPLPLRGKNRRNTAVFDQIFNSGDFCTHPFSPIMANFGGAHCASLCNISCLSIEPLLDFSDFFKITAVRYLRFVIMFGPPTTSI